MHTNIQNTWWPYAGLISLKMLFYCIVLTFPFMHLADTFIQSRICEIWHIANPNPFFSFDFIFHPCIHLSILQNKFVEGRETLSTNGQTITGLQIYFIFHVFSTCFYPKTTIFILYKAEYFYFIYFFQTIC